MSETGVRRGSVKPSEMSEARCPSLNDGVRTESGSLRVPLLGGCDMFCHTYLCMNFWVRVREREVLM